MANWFKIYETDLDEKRLKYALNKLPEVGWVWVNILSECCKHRSDTIRYSPSGCDILGFSDAIKVSVGKINEAVNILAEIEYIQIGEGRITVNKWESKQSEYNHRKSRGDYRIISDTIGDYPLEERRGEDKRGEGEPPASEDLPELPTVEQAITQTMTAGIPEDFTRYVYDDWSSRQGKDAGGVLVKFLPYVVKRWTREQVEWKAKTHKGRKDSPKQSTSSGPPLRLVQSYCAEKWGDDPRHVNWAISFHRYWSDPKREWKRQGKAIDWMPELTKQVAKWREVVR